MISAGRARRACARGARDGREDPAAAEGARDGDRRAIRDRAVAHRLTFRNLLQREGYESLDAVRDEGREEGREEGRARAVLAVLAARKVPVPDEIAARILACHDAAKRSSTGVVRARTSAAYDRPLAPNPAASR